VFPVQHSQAAVRPLAPLTELLGWRAPSKQNYDNLPEHFPPRAFRSSRATRNFCMCGVPQPSEHLDFQFRDCGSWHKAARNRSMNLRSPEALGLRGLSLRLRHLAQHARTLQTNVQRFAKALPATSTSFGKGSSELLHVWFPTTVPPLQQLLTSRLRHFAQTGKCRIRCATFFSDSGAGRGMVNEKASVLGRISQADVHHLAKTFPTTSMTIPCATFQTLRIMSSHLVHDDKVQSALCGASQFSEPRTERWEYKHGSCWAGNYTLCASLTNSSISQSLKGPLAEC
jgi:hypothetical protein